MHVVWRDFTKVIAMCLQGFLPIGTQVIFFFDEEVINKRPDSH